MRSRMMQLCQHGYRQLCMPMQPCQSGSSVQAVSISKLPGRKGCHIFASRWLPWTYELAGGPAQAQAVPDGKQYMSDHTRGHPAQQEHAVLQNLLILKLTR